jgi:hypothetical protein
LLLSSFPSPAYPAVDLPCGCPPRSCTFPVVPCGYPAAVPRRFTLHPFPTVYPALGSPTVYPAPVPDSLPCTHSPTVYPAPYPVAPGAPLTLQLLPLKCPWRYTPPPFLTLQRFLPRRSGRPGGCRVHEHTKLKRDRRPPSHRFFSQLPFRTTPPRCGKSGFCILYAASPR